MVTLIDRNLANIQAADILVGLWVTLYLPIGRYKWEPALLSRGRFIDNSKYDWLHGDDDDVIR